MSKRIRLTQKSRQAVENSPPFPGDVGNEGRPYKRRDQYDNWQEVVNHPLPDMRTEWKNNPRDEIGFGIPDANPPTVASVKLAASKRVRLSVLLLGDKCPEEVIEDQARDFFALGEEVVDRTLARFSDTQELYKQAKKDEEEDDEEDDQDEAADEDDDKKASETEATEAESEVKEASEETEEKTEEPKEAAEETPDKPEEKEASEEDKFETDVQVRLAELKSAKDAEDHKAKVEARAQELLAQEATEEPKEATEDKTEEPAKESKEAEEKTADEPKEASEDKTEDESKEAAKEQSEEPEKQANMGEMDIELTTAMPDEPVADTAMDAKLAQLFDSPQTEEKSEESANKVEASEKQGVKTLGGQPKVASSGDKPADLSQLWKTAPDVSEAFK